MICDEPEHQRRDVYLIDRLTGEKIEKYGEWKARVLLKPFPRGGFLENLKFYLNPKTIKRAYYFGMYNLEEKSSSLYKFLVSLGLPEPHMDKI